MRTGRPDAAGSLLERAFSGHRLDSGARDRLVRSLGALYAQRGRPPGDPSQRAGQREALSPARGGGMGSMLAGGVAGWRARRRSCSRSLVAASSSGCRRTVSSQRAVRFLAVLGGGNGPLGVGQLSRLRRRPGDGHRVGAPPRGPDRDGLRGVRHEHLVPDARHPRAGGRPRPLGPALPDHAGRGAPFPSDVRRADLRPPHGRHRVDGAHPVGAGAGDLHGPGGSRADRHAQVPAAQPGERRPRAGRVHGLLPGDDDLPHRDADMSPRLARPAGGDPGPGVVAGVAPGGPRARGGEPRRRARLDRLALPSGGAHPGAGDPPPRPARDARPAVPGRADHRARRAGRPGRMDHSALARDRPGLAHARGTLSSARRAGARPHGAPGAGRLVVPPVHGNGLQPGRPGRPRRRGRLVRDARSRGPRRRHEPGGGRHRRGPGHRRRPVRAALADGGPAPDRRLDAVRAGGRAESR